MDSLSKCCFPPIVGPEARILVLGTLPGEESLRLQQYYGHSRNHFWPIIAEVCGEKLPSEYSDRIAMVMRSRIALWDVLKSAVRDGTALDSAIANECANDFASFFREYPKIRTIAFNGNNALKFFRRHVQKTQDLPADLVFLETLPSTSPAYARQLSEKTARWQNAFSA
ncbi:DNA-deoxyinosine glycosylase [Hyphomicrobium methylovorum]|uniref:DNA-deoxyinosine glycosylase n=1 Tax=Hyphomicrobium methylovorum TaxID=84 RepID=UPI0015E707AA|nr:DNA-deoxyinosine glycosylase [Hyphomicrobium methylovorum]MBA2126537.1 DNA-deoxyinosine glycosylase [Hyphomicrobium methylovorum]